ncbi:3-hydroxy-9,10-secoandrosta-1,3,5(10)-triene-9,17-dione monooxygenase reductase component [Parafrankia irregularis]|uniref:3-hydroxy-9,10-secoandrosta-1,3,5(10)-triene-9,17-dione monooxygenase reductase component n=1 Tax=Parafrankia irregularis TaxID=795642 RepID=A0A0S4QXC5_9ACTN|nr:MULTISPECIES: flavin reductase family protein [Parafrankia]MBE3203397.1 flavin reductase family protein [Parafrankia sp. CH37]CUU60261.1 3-hydroxy-9,10-secoandrosta-1,3,5(10)-triene-9,17-dione monooxygenase reductase component [Parafrankia irregularis]
MTQATCDVIAQRQPSEEGAAATPRSVFTATESADFRAVLGHFCSGIVIVTAMDGSEPVGMTCQSFSSASLTPPLVMFLPARTSTSYPRIRAAGHFCVNVLDNSQEAVSAQFSRSGTDKWNGISWTPAENGAPVLDGALAWMECTLHREYDAGDHVITLGLVERLGAAATGEPLLYFRGAYGQFLARS